ncbi:lysophospholipid acyltransferase family protein [Pikeienuella sp. HZG-20]|uniref:lysophospholipid acyltransferase family protein n=1 Tax=Paludibacillus litoralis TaxID=3133267 RepID=UPI0030ED6AAA
MTRRLRVAAFNIVFYTVTFVWAMYVAAACRFVSADRVRAMIARWCRWVRWWVRVGLSGRIEIRGREKLPAAPYILAPKHQSELDVCVIFGAHPESGAVVMKELANLPFLGRLIKKMDLITVSVEHGPQGLTDMIRDGARRVAGQGRPILIYPEGELMALGARARYRTGVFNIYDAAQIPVVPVAQSLGAIWPKREWGKKLRRSGAIRYLKPIPPGLGKEEFMARLENVVEEATMELIREHATGADLAAAEDRYARKAGNE